MEARTSAITGTLSEFLSLNKWIFFVITVLVSCFFNYYIATYFATEDVMFNTFGEQVSAERIQEMLESNKRLWFITYAAIPLVIIIRICYNTVFLAIGNFLMEKNLRISQIFNACLKAEFVFLLMGVVKVLFITFFINVETVNDLNIVPLSANHLLASVLSKWLLQPMGYINVFELLFMALLAGFVTIYNEKKYAGNFVFVLTSYGAGLLIWIIFISYFTLMLT